MNGNRRKWRTLLYRSIKLLCLSEVKILFLFGNNLHLFIFKTMKLGSTVYLDWLVPEKNMQENCSKFGNVASYSLNNSPI